MRLLLTILLVLFSLPVDAMAFRGGASDIEDPCLPFVMDSNDSILTSEKLVLAHYFPRQPLSIDNLPAYRDYYQRNYLSPFGESHKWLANGGLQRSRPITVGVEGSDYKTVNYAREVRLAIARGINGFTFDVLSMTDDIGEAKNLGLMLQAIQSVDSRFKLLIQPDMTSLSGGLDDFKTIARAYHDDGRVYHLADGRLVLAPFYSEGFTAAQWQTALSELAGEGINIAFWPTFLSLSQIKVNDFKSFAYGVGISGTPQVNANTVNINNSTISHAAGLKYMAGVSPQGYRPKSYVFWEVQGSLAFRNSWNGTILGGADAVQLMTWNDHTETTIVEPFIGREKEAGYGFYNINAYYSYWFRKGSKPAITHDVVYYFYRKMPYDAANPSSGSPTTSAIGSGYNIIEALSFLKEPATLRIATDTNTDVSASAGITRSTVSLGTVKPTFSIIRNGQTVLSFSSDITPVGQSGFLSGFLDLTYWSNSASKDAICKIEEIRK